MICRRVTPNASAMASSASPSWTWYSASASPASGAGWPLGWQRTGRGRGRGRSRRRWRRRRLDAWRRARRRRTGVRCLRPVPPPPSTRTSRKTTTATTAMPIAARMTGRREAASASPVAPLEGPSARGTDRTDGRKRAERTCSAGTAVVAEGSRARRLRDLVHLAADVPLGEAEALLERRRQRAGRILRRAAVAGIGLAGAIGAVLGQEVGADPVEPVRLRRGRLRRRDGGRLGRPAGQRRIALRSVGAVVWRSLAADGSRWADGGRDRHGRQRRVAVGSWHGPGALAARMAEASRRPAAVVPWAAAACGGCGAAAWRARDRGPPVGERRGQPCGGGLTGDARPIRGPGGGTADGGIGTAGGRPGTRGWASAAAASRLRLSRSCGASRRRWRPGRRRRRRPIERGAGATAGDGGGCAQASARPGVSGRPGSGAGSRLAHGEPSTGGSGRCPRRRPSRPSGGGSGLQGPAARADDTASPGVRPSRLTRAALPSALSTPGAGTQAPRTQKTPATAYFPEGLPPEYLRRWRA